MNVNRYIEDKISAFVTKSAIPQLEVGLWHQGKAQYLSYGSEKRSEVDVFEIGSVSKTFTATLLTVLAEKGLVQYTDKVERFQPALPFAKDVSLLQLATHTSGLPRDPLKGLILNADKALNKFSPEDYKDFLDGLKAPLRSGRFRYSNIGMALLGNLLADHLGSSYEEAVKEYILLPLGMMDTHMAPDAYDSKRLARGHNGKGQKVAHFQWLCMDPAGGWRSTSKDMLIFLQAQLGYSGSYWQQLLAKTTTPALHHSKHLQLGLGWLLTNRKSLGKIAWHNGQTIGQKSVAVCAKEAGSAIIMLSNKAPRLWQNFFPGYRIERLALEVLQALTYTKTGT